jgi:hypothetical protein
MKIDQLTIAIYRDYVSIGDIVFSTPPLLKEFQTVFPPTPERIYKEGEAYLPVLILDELGVAIRYKPDSSRVALVDVYFATAGKPSQPAKPFVGLLVLNGRELRRPMLVRAVNLSGDFEFDGKAVPAAASHRIGVSLVPKFEYIGVVNFGWNVNFDDNLPRISENRSQD